MKLYITRHGETAWNKAGRIQGSVDIPLNECGIALACRTRDGMTAEGIRFERVFSSPYLRAKETARILAEPSGVPVLLRDTIREMNFGGCEGVPLQEIRTNPLYTDLNLCFADPEHYQPVPPAEGYPQLFARVEEFLKKDLLPLEGQCESVLAVCHGAIARTFLSIIKRLPLAEFWHVSQPNCCVNLVEVKNGQMTVLEEGRLYYELHENRGIL